jgi:hypothetical protein
MNAGSQSSAQDEISGIWKSNYTYRSSEKGADSESMQYVRMYPQGGELVVETLPNNDAYFVARFWLDGDVATGSWQGISAPESERHGAVYHGAVQLIISKDHKRMKGKWVGFGKEMEVKTGPWEFIYLGEDESAIEKDKNKSN